MALWKRDTPFTPYEALPDWIAFHRAMGRANLHYQQAWFEDGRWCCPVYTLTGPFKVRERPAEGFGTTVLRAMSDSMLKAAATPLTARLHMTALLLTEIPVE